MIAIRSVMLAGLLLSGCTAATVSGPGSTGGVPTGAHLSPAGFLTVGEVPPSPFPAAPPAESPLTDDWARRTASSDPAVREQAWDEMNGPAAFQAELQRLLDILPQEEPDNFVDARIVRDPAVAAEVWFKRDAARTLTRHTSDPLFRPREGGVNAADRARLEALWMGRMRDDDLIGSLSIDPTTGVIELGVTVEEAEFRRIATERGWELGPQLKMSFAPPRPPAFADPSLAPLVRVFAREDKHAAVRMTALGIGRIILEDGCFRLASSGAEPGALVMFARESQLGRDAQGYVAVVGENPYRIGEMGAWGAPNGVNEIDPDVRQLRQACGGGPLVNVASPGSLRLFGLPDPVWVADYARANSLSYEAAWRRVIACIERQERAGRQGIEARDRCIRQFN